MEIVRIEESCGFGVLASSGRLLAVPPLLYLLAYGGGDSVCYRGLRRVSACFGGDVAKLLQADTALARLAALLRDGVADFDRLRVLRGLECEELPWIQALDELCPRRLDDEGGFWPIKALDYRFGEFHYLGWAR